MTSACAVACAIGAGAGQAWAQDDAAAAPRNWQAIAEARYRAGDLAGALDAWNRVDKLRLQGVVFEGTPRTDRALLVARADLPANGLLTAAAIDRARRRLEETPIVANAGVRYQPVSDTHARVRVALRERPVLPPGWLGWAAVGIRSLFQDELRVDVAGLTPRSDVTTGAYRWASNRPRLGAEFARPAPWGLPGIAHVEASWERQTYLADTPGGNPISETRDRAGASLADWLTSWLRWQAGAAFDHIARDPFVSVEGSINTRWLGDRLAVVVTGARAAAVRDTARAFSTVDLAVMGRSTATPDAPVWMLLAGVAGVSDAAPLAVWPGASSGKGRTALLRAHPLLESGIITGDMFGRRLAYGTLEHERPVYTSPYGSVSVAGFLDVARATRRRNDAPPTPWQYDIGGGVRFNTPSAGGTVRLDAAYGLRDGEVALSAGYLKAWGTR